MGRHLGIDILWILVDLGSQVGVENRSKIDQKWHRKNDEKKKGAKMAKKSQQEAPTTRGTTGPGEGQGGVETRRVEKKSAETRYTTLNHPSPEG